MRSPLAVVELFNPKHYNLWVFDPTNYGDSADYIYLRLFPRYESADESQGEKGYFPTFSRVATRHATTQRAFTATVIQQTGFIYRIIERLALIADTSSYAIHTPIKIIDFCSPEPVDDANTATYNGELATVRFGRIDIQKRPAIVRGFQQEYCTSEWEFKFSESKYRH